MGYTDNPDLHALHLHPDPDLEPSLQVKVWNPPDLVRRGRCEAIPRPVSLFQSGI